MDKLFLLDAYALIFRAYYALIRSPRINSKGQNTSAVYGFVSTLEEVLRREQPAMVGVAFDPSGPTFRHEAYPDYKAQRQATPEDIHAAVPIIKRLLAAYGIPCYEVPGFEADDVIGTLSLQAAQAGYDVFMLTPDKDYAQLVRPHVSIYRPLKGQGFEVLGVAEVNAKYGLTNPKQMIDLLGLMGDAADNIPGCPHVGEKTAAKLIAEYGSIDNLLAHTDGLKGVLKKNVEENAEQIRFSRYLATIRTDVPVALDAKALRRKELDKEALRRLFEELEFRSFITRYLQGEAAPPKKEPVQGDLFAAIPPEGTDAPKETILTRLEDGPAAYHLVENEDEQRTLCQKFLSGKFVSLDTETTGIDPICARGVGLSFSVAEGEAYYVPLPANEAAARRTVEIFRPVYESPHLLKIGQNLKYDMLLLQNYGIELAGPMFDTMIAHYVLQPDQPHGLDYLARIYLHYDTIKIEQLIGPRGKGQKNMADLSPRDVYRYACEDADVALRLKRVLEDELQRAGLTQLASEIEMPLVGVLARMERNGVRLDTKVLAEISVLFNRRLQEVEAQVYELAGTPFNLSSPRQVGEVLFERLHITDKPRRTKTGQYVTSEEVLQSLSAAHPIVEKILQYRGLKKLVSTYVDALPALVNPRDGHIHTSFNQTATSTGRLSSSGPNLQNIPVRGADGREIRKAFVPEPGSLFFSADYSQIELRIMAHLSGDEHMLEAFRQGFDIHAATAAKIFHKKIEDVSPDERRKAKTANFGIIYGISAFGLAQRMNVPRSEASALIKDYFATFPRVKQYIDGSIAAARSRGYVETLLGRRSHLPDINSRNATVRGYAERFAINAPIQGTAADIIKIAMIRIDRRLRKEHFAAKMILQVHDELNFSCPPEEKERLEQMVLEEMQGAYALSVPLVADCGWGQNWLEAH